MSAPSPTPPRALITGCSSGFGFLTSLALARTGYQVYATMRDPSRAPEALRTTPGIEVIQLDVTDRGSIAAAAQAVLAGGPLDVLVNNAGIGLLGALEEVAENELRAVFETNFFGAVAVTQAFLPSMRERGRGHIINVSSGAGIVGTPINGAYVASKFALEGWSESLHFELASFGVRVSLVEPAIFRTTMVDPAKRTLAAAAARESSPYRAWVTAISAMIQRVHDRPTPAADPQQVAEAIVGCVRSPRPALRYVVGVDLKRLMVARKVLPAALFERLLARAFRPGSALLPLPAKRNGLQV